MLKKIYSIFAFILSSSPLLACHQGGSQYQNYPFSPDNKEASFELSVQKGENCNFYIMHIDGDNEELLIHYSYWVDQKMLVLQKVQLRENLETHKTIDLPKYIQEDLPFLPKGTPLSVYLEKQVLAYLRQYNLEVTKLMIFDVYNLRTALQLYRMPGFPGMDSEDLLPFIKQNIFETVTGRMIQNDLALLQKKIKSLSISVDFGYNGSFKLKELYIGTVLRDSFVQSLVKNPDGTSLSQNTLVPGHFNITIDLAP